MTRTEYTNYINTLLASGSNITATELRTAMQYAADYADEATQKYLQSLPGYADSNKTYLRKDTSGGFYWGITDGANTGEAPAAPALAIDDVNDTATTTLLPEFINKADYEWEFIAT